MNKRRRFKAKRKRAARRFLRKMLSLCPRVLRGRIDDGEAEYFERYIVEHIRQTNEEMTRALGVPVEFMVEKKR